MINTQKEMTSSLIQKILYDEITNYLMWKDKTPMIVDISIGDDFGGLMYSKMKQKKIEKETPIKFQSIHFNNINYMELKNYIFKLNKDSMVTGIMLQLPLTDNLRGYEREILDLIDFKKDVDGLTSTSAGLLSVGENCLVPCTALGIEVLLKCYNIPLEGKKVAIINRSNIVGKPLFQLLLKDNCTPILCHSKTSDLSTVTRECDIVVAALNKKEYIDERYIKENAVVIDVGVHKNSENKTVGDVDYSSVYPIASYITPPVGGVGPMTIGMLAYNSVKCLYGDDANQILENTISKVKTYKK